MLKNDFNKESFLSTYWLKNKRVSSLENTAPKFDVTNLQNGGALIKGLQ